MRRGRTHAMDREGDDLVTRLPKLFAFLLVLTLSFHQVIAQSKPVLSYEKYCLGNVEMMDLWYSGHPYFWYYVGQEIKLYLLASDAGDGTWIVHGGYN